MSTGKPVDKILIKYNSNNLEQNDEKEKEQIKYWVYWEKSDPSHDENAIDLRWSDVNEEDEEDIALTNFIESL